jgi:hypothetical protein
MPSRSRSLSNGHPRSPRKLPWFLDALFWMRPLLSPEDRSILDLVRLDLADELEALLTEGVGRRDACREVRMRVRLESRFFAPRALEWQRTRLRQVLRTPHPRTLVRTAAVVGVCGIGLLSAKWFVFDRAVAAEARELSQQLPMLLDEVARTGSDLQQFATENDQGRPLTQEVRNTLARSEQLKGYLLQTERDHPGEFGLHGWIGLIDESLAEFWRQCGDEEKAAAHWCGALTSYLTGASAQDHVATLHLGLWYLDHGHVERAVSLLREAYHQSPDGPSSAAFAFHKSLVQNWEVVRDLRAVREALDLEKAARGRAREHRPTRYDAFILCNSAYLRMLMIRASALDPVVGLEIPELLLGALDVAGDSAPEIAVWLTSDQDLAELRSSPVFARLTARAQAILEQAGK